MKHVYGLHVDYEILRRKKKCCNKGEGKDQKTRRKKMVMKNY